jgi:preprotein translocase subunit YajC
MSGGGGGNPFPTLIFMGAIFLVMYFFMIRPQQKKAKEQREFQDNVQKGDKVVTNGGIHGKIAQIEDNTLLLEVDKNTKMRIEKSMLSHELTKGMRDRQSNDKKDKDNDKDKPEEGKKLKNEVQDSQSEENT